MLHKMMNNKQNKLKEFDTFAENFGHSPLTYLKITKSNRHQKISIRNIHLLDVLFFLLQSISEYNRYV